MAGFFKHRFTQNPRFFTGSQQHSSIAFIFSTSLGPILVCRGEPGNPGGEAWGRPFPMAISVRDESGGDLGAELHDRVIGRMSALILEIEQVKREPYDHSSVVRSLTYFQHAMRETLGELRDVVSHVQGGPPTGLNEGLVKAVCTGPLAELHRKTGATTKITASPRFPLRLGTFIEIQLYRITEQALRNAAQHSGAHNVAVAFRVVGGCLVVQVADDGLGHDWAQESGGQGTIGMRQRVELIGGDLQIDDRVGGGTVVRVRVPIGDWS
jgi:signal transduction histidine kinase